jgi:hypothetical protein
MRPQPFAFRKIGLHEAGAPSRHCFGGSSDHFGPNNSSGHHKAGSGFKGNVMHKLRVTAALLATIFGGGSMVHAADLAAGKAQAEICAA